MGLRRTMRIFCVGQAVGDVFGGGCGPEIADAGFADCGLGARLCEEAAVVVPLGDHSAEAFLLHGSVEILVQAEHLALDLWLHPGGEVPWAHFDGEVIGLLQGAHVDGGVLIKVVVEGCGSSLGSPDDEEVRQFGLVRQRGSLPRWRVETFAEDGVEDFSYALVYGFGFGVALDLGERGGSYGSLMPVKEGISPISARR